MRPLQLPEAGDRLQTQYGPISFHTERESGRDFPLMIFATVGKLFSLDDQESGTCEFYTYRRKRNQPQLDGESVAALLEPISHQAMELGEALLEADPCGFEDSINFTCLLEAQRIVMKPWARGTGAWKVLYFRTMEQALRHAGRIPMMFYFKAYPIEFKGGDSPDAEAAFGRAERALKLLYSIHLGATVLKVPEHLGCFMSAPVPDEVRKALAR